MEERAFCRTNEQCQTFADPPQALGVPALVPRVGPFGERLAPAPSLPTPPTSSSAPAGLVVIDHKTFPGLVDAALDRALTYSGQLAAYARAASAATSLPVASLWIHFPVLGRAVEVHIVGGDAISQ